MEALQNLEKKIATLLDLVEKIKKENAGLVDQNAELTQKLKDSQDALLHDVQGMSSLQKERTEALSAIDSLIKSIDTFVEREK
jgi:regulator of replication initiation timing